MNVVVAWEGCYCPQYTTKRVRYRVPTGNKYIYITTMVNNISIRKECRQYQTLYLAKDEKRFLKTRIFFSWFSDLSDALDEETHQELVYPQGDQTLYSDQPFGPVAARKVTEVVQSAVGILKTAIDYPRELITDAARPGYWVPDSEILACSCCNAEFKETDAKHHCRACGMGVCSKCSESRRPVPSKGWDHPVRVCDQCASKKGQL